MSHLRINSYHVMWLFVMFDLPTTTPKERKAYTSFRKSLELDGFTMHQFSVYIRHCASVESTEVHIRRIRKVIPPKGKVSILTITDKQFSKIITIWGSIEQKSTTIPLQLELF